MKRISLSVLLLVLIASGAAHAIRFEVELSPGSTFYHPTLGATYYKANTDMYLDLKMANNDGFTHTGYSQSNRFFARVNGVETDDIPVNWLNVGGYPDGTGPLELLNGWEYGTIWTFFSMITVTSWDGILPDSINHTTATVTGWEPDDVMLTRFRYHFNFPLGGTDVAEFCIDSCDWNNPDYDWLFPVEVDFGGPYCFEFAAVPDLIVDKDFLRFEAVENDPLPASQTIVMQNNSDLPSLSWSASKSSGWLSLVPSSGSIGSTPVAMQVLVTTTTLPPGLYNDVITITAPDAGNSPILVPVEYEIFGNPPIIEIAPTNFIFNAVAGMSNPADQYLTINNIGFSDLNWTASNSESWLSLSPGSGLNNGTVTLSIDITGLPFGIYNDVIVVEDPEADNSPQMAYVQLEVSSDLPVIEIDSTHIFVIANVDYPPDRKFNITNGGAGTMNYYLQENGLHIVGLNPTSGSVPQEVTVEFKTIGASGIDLFDTVWVYSNEAVNSPQFVEFQIHFTDTPAEISVNKTSIAAEYYECGQGLVKPLDENALLNFFTVSNLGGEILTFQIEPTEDWLTLSTYSGNAPELVYFSLEYRGLAPGIYTDSIHISAPNAINSPVYIPVELTILEATESPEIAVTAENAPGMVFATQTNTYGPSSWLVLNNLYPGCMDWEFSHLPPWLLVVNEEETSYPWQLDLTPSGHGLARGTYYDNIIINAPDATNSPLTLNTKLYIWELYGDTDFNGVLNILDIIILVNYLYKGGHEPLPVPIVGDCNCDGIVDILDCVALVNYLYKDGDVICGNPY